MARMTFDACRDGRGLRSLFSVVPAVLLGACSVFGIRTGTEEQPYAVRERLGTSVEIRQYAPRLAADTTETMAVYRYSGEVSPAREDIAHRELLSQLGGSGWLSVGEPTDWFYDPPWTIPPLRRNEAAVAVTKNP